MTGERPQPNFYAAGGLDRAALRRRDAAWLAARLADPATRLVPVWRSQSFVVHGETPAAAHLGADMSADLLRMAGTVVLLGLVGEVAHFAVDLSHLDDPAGDPLLGSAGRFVDLRAVGPLLGHDEGSLLAYARGLVHWHARHRFCGICGARTESAEAGHVRRCANPDCAAVHFPRTDPAVIVLVTDSDRALLGRQKIWPPGMHSTLAGFVETGESLEDAVRREIREEAGIEVGDVRYHSSQPWPFPSSIMLGFTARALTTELSLDDDELEFAGWFSRDQLKASPENETFRLPRRDSIARRLVEDWLSEG
jgi:NAD+ diphosphatase